MYLTLFFNEDGEFVHFNDFNVNLPLAVILGLKRFLHLFVNMLMNGIKRCVFFFYQNPLPTFLKSTRKYLYNVFISSCNTCTSVKLLELNDSFYIIQFLNITYFYIYCSYIKIQWANCFEAFFQHFWQIFIPRSIQPVCSAWCFAGQTTSKNRHSMLK